jgi:tRNA(adenine34) deaminase
MTLALDQAQSAFSLGEIPVGAVLVRDGGVIGTAHNLREATRDPSAHAEVLALRDGAAKSDGWRLTGTTLYVTKEPCIMCAGALVNARVMRLVYGCTDIKAGGVRSLYRILEDRRLNHQVEVVPGVMEQECAALLKKFFADRRKATESKGSSD